MNTIRISSVKHIGFEVKYHHPDSDALELPPATVDHYENKKEKARIFIQSGEEEAFSSVELLEWFLLQTKTSLTDHLPKDAGEWQDGRCFVAFPMRFPENMFHMTTSAGRTGMKSLKLLIQVTVG